jgi:hypothetical protein
MADDKGPLDHALDLLVFAPLGFLTESRSMYPQLVEEGRSQVHMRVQVARMIGELAVRKGQQEVAKVVERRRSAEGTDQAGPAAATGPDDGDDVAVPMGGGDDEMDDIVESDLAIPSYGSLAASQVVSRLEGLSPVELESVRRYELAHRGRKTVLGKIAHLQSTA